MNPRRIDHKDQESSDRTLNGGGRYTERMRRRISGWRPNRPMAKRRSVEGSGVAVTPPLGKTPMRAKSWRSEEDNWLSKDGSSKAASGLGFGPASLVRMILGLLGSGRMIGSIKAVVADAGETLPLGHLKALPPAAEAVRNN